MNIEIIYQDKYIVAINKPKGLLVHKSELDNHETLFALQLTRDKIGKYVYPIHRLDKPTSGVLLFALDEITASKLNGNFKNHEISKTYVAIVRGHIQNNGLIDHDLKRIYDKKADKNKNKDKEPQSALTEYKCIQNFTLAYPIGKYSEARYSIVELTPKSGRKHQFRRHMKHISHPIIGDTKYGKGEHNRLFREKLNCYRLLLHAQTLKFIHPITNKNVIIKAKFDNDFTEILKVSNA